MKKKLVVAMLVTVMAFTTACGSTETAEPAAEQQQPAEEAAEEIEEEPKEAAEEKPEEVEEEPAEEEFVPEHEGIIEGTGGSVEREDGIVSYYLSKYYISGRPANPDFVGTYYNDWLDAPITVNVELNEDGSALIMNVEGLEVDNPVTLYDSDTYMYTNEDSTVLAGFDGESVWLQVQHEDDETGGWADDIFANKQ